MSLLSLVSGYTSSSDEDEEKVENKHEHEHNKLNKEPKAFKPSNTNSSSSSSVGGSPSSNLNQLISSTTTITTSKEKKRIFTVPSFPLVNSVDSTNLLENNEKTSNLKHKKNTLNKPLSSLILPPPTSTSITTISNTNQKNINNNNKFDLSSLTSSSSKPSKSSFSTSSPASIPSSSSVSTSVPSISIPLFSFSDDTQSSIPSTSPLFPEKPPSFTLINPESLIANNQSEPFDPSSTIHKGKKRKQGPFDEQSLLSSGIKIHEVNIKETLAKEDVEKLAERMSGKTPIQEHLSASTKLSILNLAKKAVTQADELEKMYASHRAKKRMSAAKYGF